MDPCLSPGSLQSLVFVASAQRGLISLDGECAQREGFIPILQVLAQGQRLVSGGHSLLGSAAQDQTCRRLQAVGHLCRVS